MSDQISGRMAQLKPGHFVLIGAITVLSVALIPALSGLTTKKKAEDTTAATLAANAGNTGEPWHPPTFPVTEAAVYKPPPAAPQTITPASPLIAASATAVGSNAPSDFRMFGQRAQPPQSAAPDQPGNGQPQRVAAADGTMAAFLKPTQTDGYSATRMQHPWATIEQGRIIACNSVTPMTSELPGFVKAKITYDVRGADGTTTLIDRNSDIFGEIGHGLAGGQDRLFVLWRSVLTPPPDLVRITLNSPAADELGESGLPGDIDHHTWRRIGGALLLSGVDALLQGGSQALANSTSHGGSGGGGLNLYSFQGQGSSLASSLLQHTVEIPDVLHRDQALACSIFASGDLDFSSVYSLRRKP